MKTLAAVAILMLTAMSSGLCSDSTPKPPPSSEKAPSSSEKTAAPIDIGAFKVTHATPAGPGKKVLWEVDSQGHERQSLVSTGVLLKAEELPKLDMARILSLAEVQKEFPKATEAATVNTYETLNKGLPGYDDGLLAVQLFAIFATVKDKHGEGWLQAAAFHAVLARQDGNKDVLVKAIADVFRLVIHDTDKTLDTTACVNDVLELQHSAYPPAVKLTAVACALPFFGLFVDNQADPGVDPDDPRLSIPPLLDAGVAQIEVLAKQGIAATDLREYADLILGQTTIDGNRPGIEWRTSSPQSFTGANREHYEKKIAEVLARTKAPEEVETFLKAKYLIDLASAARGTGWAGSVTKEQAEKMHGYLEQARDLLAEAGKKYPDNVQVPLLMMSTAFGDMTKESLIEWFHKAIAIDPHCVGAHRIMMCYLQPKWYGSGQEMVDFGVMCWQTQDWDNGVPMVLPWGMNMLAADNPGLY
ncbi:MAG: DUF4034 domain-containing protein, partial [Chthoniobacterales bacterium]